MTKEKEEKYEADVYISCGEPDLEIGKRIYDDLKKAGVTPWMESVDLKPGRDPRKAVQRIIENCEYFLALLSSKSLSEKGLVQKEQKAALGVFDEYAPDDIFIIPVRIDDCKPSDDTLRGLKSVDLFKSYEDGLKQILGVVGRI